MAKKQKSIMIIVVIGVMAVAALGICMFLLQDQTYFKDLLAMQDRLAVRGDLDGTDFKVLISKSEKSDRKGLTVEYLPGAATRSLGEKDREEAAFRVALVVQKMVKDFNKEIWKQNQMALKSGSSGFGGIAIGLPSRFVEVSMKRESSGFGCGMETETLAVYRFNNNEESRRLNDLRRDFFNEFSSRVVHPRFVLETGEGGEGKILLKIFATPRDGASEKLASEMAVFALGKSKLPLERARVLFDDKSGNSQEFEYRKGREGAAVRVKEKSKPAR